MSQQNVELVRRGFEAWRQDEPWADFLDPEIEWDFSANPGWTSRLRALVARTMFGLWRGTFMRGSTTRRISGS